MAQARRIAEKAYREICRRVPIACVDVVVACRGSFLLGLRAQSPARGRWFLPGGRILKGERLAWAASRKLADELGLRAAPSRFRFLAVDETMFQGPSQGGSKHTINVVFALRLARRPRLRLDLRQNSRARWFSAVEPGWHPYVRRALAAAGFKARRKRAK
ncbi:MAG: NUDIX domain-containing protein [Elusimicrobia bacterium]|nr:NUDIX domain-containing protein [Elusimicrobiota bacterium]MDE2237565.1 NUDIX domain-containing protein [Elusimicrobiota bacterium]MDE2425049.1 NUDIX domain-containing protein [Elusimicrobiota bacterium]